MKKCSQCGKICESNFCPDCGSEMLEVNIEPEPNGDDAQRCQRGDKEAYSIQSNNPEDQDT